MISLGHIIKEARRKKGYSFSKLEEKTKIRTSFLQALEKEQWSLLPEFPVVVGFVKSVAGALNIEEGKATAFLRRDYPPKKLFINPKPDVSNKFLWSPVTTFFLGLSLIIVGALCYLGYQYYQFLSPPKLIVVSPEDGAVVKERNIKIVGSTDENASVTVNNQPIFIEETGDFVTSLEIFEGTEDVLVVATSRAGKETVVRRKIIPRLGTSD